MLNLFRRGGASKTATQLLIAGDTAAADGIAEGARAAGHGVTRVKDAAALRSHGPSMGAGVILLATGDEAADLAFAQTVASEREPAKDRSEAWLTLGIIAESQPILSAIQDLDARTGETQLRIRPLSVTARSARRVLLGRPLPRLHDTDGTRPIAIAGTGPGTSQLLLQLCRMMHFPKQKPHIVIVGPEAAAWLNAMTSAVPGLQEAAAIETSASWDHDGLAQPSEIYVTDAALWTGMAPPPWYVPIYWFAGAGIAPDKPGIFVSRDDWSDMAASLFSDPLDRQAEAIHQLYLEERRHAGETAGSRPAMQPWALLPERFRSASRHQADHIAFKLMAIGCRIAPAKDGPQFSFTSSEVEALADAEHRRWAAVQLFDGWRYGAVRDDSAKLTPALVPTEALSRDMRELDRLAIRAIPMHLDRTGHTILRDLTIEMGAAANAALVSGFDAGLIHLLKDIAVRHPGSALALRSKLTSPLECRAAEIALQNGLATLELLIEDMKERSPALAARAETITVAATGTAPAKPGLALCLGGEIARTDGVRSIVMETNGRVRSAPWL